MPGFRYIFFAGFVSSSNFYKVEIVRSALHSLNEHLSAKEFNLYSGHDVWHPFRLGHNTLHLHLIFCFKLSGWQNRTRCLSKKVHRYAHISAISPFF